MKNQTCIASYSLSSFLKLISRLSLIFALSLGLLASANAKDPVNSTTFGNVAIKGYDPVAYFLESKPVKGSKKYQVEWKGAKWRFVSKANKTAFEADPKAYAPQYGGYCAWAVSQGYTAGIDPDAWDIVDGKLYLNYSKSVQADWKKDRASLIEKADKNWPEIISE